MGGFGIIVFGFMLLGVVAVLVTVLVLSIVYRSKVGVAVSCLGVVVSGLPLLYILHWTLISPFNMWGLLKREPAASELVAEYRLDPGWSSSYISAMGYKNLSGSEPVRFNHSQWRLNFCRQRHPGMLCSWRRRESPPILRRILFPLGNVEDFQIFRRLRY